MGVADLPYAVGTPVDLLGARGSVPRHATRIRGARILMGQKMASAGELEVGTCLAGEVKLDRLKTCLQPALRGAPNPARLTSHQGL